MPRLFGHGSTRKWSARQELHLRSLGPKPRMLLATLRAGYPADLPAGEWFGGDEAADSITEPRGKMADPKGLAPSALPQTTGRSAN